MLSQQRKDMIAFLKREVVPYLRSHQFQGSFPHFRRIQSDRIDLVTFQFNRHGGSFIVVLAQAPPTGFQTYWGEQISPQKMTPMISTSTHDEGWAVILQMKTVFGSFTSQLNLNKTIYA
nr:DUF4304 domain-containing protein [Exiguobacterium sp. s160]